jgi:hypothetical protein
MSCSKDILLGRQAFFFFSKKVLSKNIIASHRTKGHQKNHTPQMTVAPLGQPANYLNDLR